MDAIKFCEKLSRMEGRVYRLPTDPEWEYACRAGTLTTWNFGNRRSLLKDHAWFDDNSGNTTHSVARKSANSWGFFDMHGNVAEWCHSVYKPEGEGSWRVIRGGGWLSDAGMCRSVSSTGDAPMEKCDTVGFRVACQWTKPPPIGQ